MIRTKASLLASGALLASLILASYAVLANANRGESDSPKPTQDEIQAPLPTPAAPSPIATTRVEAEAILQSSSPATLQAIRAIEQKDPDAIKTSLHWRSFECSTTPGSSVAPTCLEADVAPGTSVPMFLYELTEYSYRTESDTLRILHEILRPGPRLGLVARRGDGSYLVAFTLEAADPSQPRGVNFAVAQDAGGKFSSYTEKFGGSTPLDDLREFDRRQPLPSVLIYVSDDLLRWEEDKHLMQTAPALVPNQKP